MDRLRGYTLIELMMVVALIGLGSSIAVPTISTAMAENKESEGALQVVAVYRSGRATAMQLGTPTLVAASLAPGGQFWIIPAPRLPGVVSSCGSVNWLPLYAANAVPANTDLDFDAGTGPNGDAFGWTTYGITVTNLNVAAAAVCYSPLGRVYISSGVAGPFSDAQNAAPGGALVVRVSRPNSNPRRAIIPMGSGMPRLGI